MQLDIAFLSKIFERDLFSDGELLGNAEARDGLEDEGVDELFLSQQKVFRRGVAHALQYR